MASIKECRARTKKLGLRFTILPKTDYWYKRGERYKVYAPGRGYIGTKVYGKTIAEISKQISSLAREQRRSEMMRKLNGHRPKYGYKTVPRKSKH